MSNDYTEDQGDSDWDDVDTEEPEQETEEATEQDAAPEPQVELDPEDPIEFPEQFYDVQEDYEHEGQTIAAGTSVPIKCANCAAWEAPLQARGGKPLCRPGQSFGLPVKAGEEPKKWRMQENRYSCQTHFIPKDMEDVLPLLTNDPDQVKMLLWAFPAVAALVKLIERIQQHHKKVGGDPEKSLNRTIDFLLLFRSQQQQQLVKPFIKMVSKQLTERKPKKLARRKDSFKSGDNVSWEVAGSSGARAEGFIQTIGGRGNLVTIIVAGPSVQVLCPDSTQNAIRWQRPVPEWKEMDPKVLSTTPIVTEK